LNDTDAFLEHRPLLLSIAYRMLGSYAEAEDIVQESFISWTSRRETDVRSNRAFLTTIVMRLCLDRLKSAAKKREEYPGTWLPEPVETSLLFDPALRAERRETVSTAFLLLLERLSPAERAVFLLRDVFDFDYSDIAGIVGKSEENCRQLNTRARKHVRQEETRAHVPEEHKHRLLAGFLDAITRGNLSNIVDLLARDVRLWTDSGGKVQAAARNIIYGQDHVARFFVGIRAKQPHNITMRLVQINGDPGIVLYAGEHIYSVVRFDFDENGIRNIYSTVNPEKFGSFKRLGRPGPLSRVLVWWRILRHLKKNQPHL
jgi:RNA polymerase sigma-70 factor (ECF subfamily)